MTATIPNIQILIPVFNDWSALKPLLGLIDMALCQAHLGADVLVVNDGSTEDPPADLGAGPYQCLGTVLLLSLRRNLGHQRAIAIGLAYTEAHGAHDTIVIMDGDGEDDPADVPRLIDRAAAEDNRMIVFAERTRRSESWLFQMFYQLYKLAHVILTGEVVRVGNFSALPRRRLESLVVVDALWNHYAAAVFRSRQPYCMIPTRRARRLSGHSTMNFVSLVTHGLSAISVYGDVVGVRLLVLTGLLSATALMGLVATLVIRFTTTWAIPGWATVAAGILGIMLLQAGMIAFLLSFVILGARHDSTFLPCRDYVHFVSGVRVLPMTPPAARAAEPNQGNT